MELFPDLSLQISPPNPNLHSTPKQAEAAAPTDALLFVDLNLTKVSSSSGHHDANQNYIQGFLGTKIPLYHQYHNQLMRSRFISRYRVKRSTRAPRMRWTTTLHARFARAVHLLGGHQRATPKSVLELMNVKDLTLAHVKSHLQMYRTVKITGRAAGLSGHYDVFDDGSSGDMTSEDLMFDTQNIPRFDASSVLSNGILQDKDLCSSSRRT